MSNKKKIAVVLAGCGVYDGAEIHEAIMTLWAIDKAGAVYQCFAPDIKQHHVINHLSGEEMKEERNVLVEAARIARGDIKALNEYSPREFDGLIFPGGFGVAKNLSTLAFDGPKLTILDEVKKVVQETVRAGKPIGALCIAPAVLAGVLNGAKVTVGSDAGTIQAVEALGGEHEVSTHGEIVIDEKYKLVTTPCYMLDATIAQIAKGAEKVVDTLLDL
jgi:enhancing lycopene biosynthesis protein 2